MRVATLMVVTCTQTRQRRLILLIYGFSSYGILLDRKSVYASHAVLHGQKAGNGWRSGSSVSNSFGIVQLIKLKKSRGVPGMTVSDSPASVCHFKSTGCVHS